MGLVRPLALDLKDGIDRKTLKSLKKRFLDVNQGRLDRTLNSLSDRHRDFLNAVPLLLHVNHPLLPGYNNGRAPFGISQFEASKEQIRAAASVDKGFQYKRDPHQKTPIHALALMGSAGTVAYSKKSDMDFWVVHSPNLKQVELEHLRKKLDTIQDWTAAMGLEVYFFLINPDKFRRAEREEVLSGEDCGSTQHYLLLDEFYRTGLLIAGRYPIWWLIPANQEHDYTEISQALVNKRFIEKDDVFDIGGISDFPAGEFFGAGLWQLYKGIDSPYKSVLKILLTEVYASEYPKVKPLSLIYKQAIYEGKLELNELDPYVLVYRKIEKYLQHKKEDSRLELARRCLYFKVNQAVSKPPTRKEFAWAHELMSNLVDEWQWQKHKLVDLDLRAQWKVMRVISERKSVVNELNLSYRFLSNFARENKSKAHVNHRDMTILGRKLYAAFERKSGKTELVNPGIAPNISEEYLSFYHEPPTSDDDDSTMQAIWSMYSGYVQGDELAQELPLKKSRSLISLIVWAYFNQLIDSTTRYLINAPQTALSEHELQRIIHSLFQLFPNGLTSPQQESFEKLAYSSHAVIYINVGRDPMQSMNKKGIQRLSNHTDALSYSGLQNNLVLQVDQLFINSWNEITTNHFNTATSVIDCLVDFLRNHPPDKVKRLPKLDIRCYCPTRSVAIAKRVKELFSDVINAFYANKLGRKSRYILEFETRFYMIHYEGTAPLATVLNNYDALLRYLSLPIEQYSPITFDRYALESSLLASVITKSKPNCVQVFYLKQKVDADIYILDENGSLCTFSTFNFKDTAFMNQMQRFICAALNRQSVKIDRQGSSDTSISLKFYELIPATNKQGAGKQGTAKKSTKESTKIIERSHDADETLNNYFQVQVICDKDMNGKTLYTVYCDHQEFSQLDYGDKLYKAVANHINSQRQPGTHYPIYITDIDLSRTGEHGNTERDIQISEYLQHKQRLESLLNSALFNGDDTTQNSTEQKLSSAQPKTKNTKEQSSRESKN